MQRKFHENILTIYPHLARRVIDKVLRICLMDTGYVPASVLTFHELLFGETKFSKLFSFFVASFTFSPFFFFFFFLKYIFL